MPGDPISQIKEKINLEKLKQITSQLKLLVDGYKEFPPEMQTLAKTVFPQFEKISLLADLNALSVQ